MSFSLLLAFCAFIAHSVQYANIANFLKTEKTFLLIGSFLPYPSGRDLVDLVEFLIPAAGGTIYKIYKISRAQRAGPFIQMK